MSIEERETEQRRIREEHSLQLRLILHRSFKLGEGRTAEVYLGAYRTQVPDHDGAAPTWQLCAVKRIEPSRDSQLAGLDEVFALRRLGAHPHIVRLLDVLDEMGLPTSNNDDTRSSASDSANDPPRLLIVLEYLPFTLASFVQRHPHAVTFERWLEWARELSSVVEWLHTRGCVHGDLKKENVLLSHDLHVKLCDFSSVLFSNAAIPATDVYTVGTPAFRAPELFTATRWTPSDDPGEAHPALSFTIDIFSLGVLLYVLATGVEPSMRTTSIMARRQRQSLFFRQEEDDRIERLIESYASTPGDERELTPASSTTSRTSPCSPSAAEDERMPHALPALTDQLLDTQATWTGLLTSGPSSSVRATSSGASTGNERTVSLHVPEAGEMPSLSRCVSLSAAAAQDRPIRRTNSAYRPKQRGDVQQGHVESTSRACGSSELPLRAPAVLMTPPAVHTTPLPAIDGRPYADGAPPLVLPGGGRLPDELRDLIQSMVEPTPSLRPTAADVHAVLSRPWTAEA